MNAIRTLLAGVAAFALHLSLILAAGCPLSTNCEGLVYNEELNTCECAEGSTPNYERQACEFADGRIVPWTGLPVPYIDGGTGLDARMGEGDAGPDAVFIDAPDAPEDDGGNDAGRVPAPADVSARFPWNGFATGSVHVPDAEPLVDHPLRPKFMWNEVPEADHYQVQLTRGCTTEGFRTCDFERPDLDETTSELIFRPSSSLTVARTIPVGSRYFWRVRACSESNLCSAWTDVRYLDVGRGHHDFNGDGYADVVVGARSPSVGGRLYVFFGAEAGASDTPDITLMNRRSAVGAGDLDADGFMDLATRRAGPEGGIDIFFGSPDGPTREETLPRLGWADSFFGTGLDAAGDVDGDGYADLIVGAPNGDSPARNTGILYLYRGRPSGIDTSPAFSVANPAGQVGGEFGAAIAAGGDTNGDGFVDLVVAAPGQDNPETDEGTIYIYHGGPGLFDTVFRTIDPPDDRIRARMGWGLAMMDLNADGYSDIAVTTQGAGSDDLAGLVYGFFGSIDSVIDTPQFMSRSRSDSRVRAAGDVNGDGFADIVISNPTTGAQNGNVAVFLGGTDEMSIGTISDTTIQNPLSGQGVFGGSMAGRLDVNGDGYADMVVGARFESHGEYLSGAAYVFYGARSGVTVTPGTSLANPLDDRMGEFGACTP